MWLFAVLLILAAGMFPLQAILGLGGASTTGKSAIFVGLFVVIALTVFFIKGLHWQLLSLLTLVLIGLWRLPLPQDRRGVHAAPERGDGDGHADRRAARERHAGGRRSQGPRRPVARHFPEVESVIGKAGRADTPTDPAPLEMVETFVNFRPKELWPKRVMHFDDAVRQTRAVLAKLEQQGYVQVAKPDDRDALVNEATMSALDRFDETMRARWPCSASGDFERERFAVAETLAQETTATAACGRGEVVAGELTGLRQCRRS